MGFSFCWFSFVGNSSESFFVSGVMIMAERCCRYLVRCESGLSFDVGSIFLLWSMYLRIRQDVIYRLLLYAICVLYIYVWNVSATSVVIINWSWLTFLIGVYPTQ